MRKSAVIFFLLLPSLAGAFLSEDEIAFLQRASAGWTIGEKIAFWAEQFIDTPYDTDPLGEYVRERVIVADDRVDCMYHVFRSVELARGKDPADSVSAALDLRFHGKGKLENNRVMNYEDRFRYGEDMIESGKWGREITSELGETATIKGERGRSRVSLIDKKGIPNILDRLRNGDVVFFIKDPRTRTAGEIVGHIGIIKTEEDKTYLISASGIKKKGGTVKKMLLSEYSVKMPFVGIKVTRPE